MHGNFLPTATLSYIFLFINLTISAGELVPILGPPPALASYEPPADDEPLPVPGGQEEEVLQLARLPHPPPAPQVLALCATGSNFARANVLHVKQAL